MTVGLTSVVAALIGACLSTQMSLHLPRLTSPLQLVPTTIEYGSQDQSSITVFLTTHSKFPGREEVCEQLTKTVAPLLTSIMEMPIEQGRRSVVCRVNVGRGDEPLAGQVGAELHLGREDPDRGVDVAKFIPYLRSLLKRFGQEAAQAQDAFTLTVLASVLNTGIAAAICAITLTPSLGPKDDQ